ncbi:MAG: tRNA uridine-5-carboxymethylaminomethyl(34) synthesis GTPase MnmE [Ignavibacteriales bacterium]|nr:tRNA uridine-5-carboxymethylaminomethyl(34) synthesis GTPase MnmE [Ignavibacteriales bacterium]
MPTGHSDDTIVAIATPPGEGGISVVRLSGPEAIPFASKGFSGKGKLAKARSHTAHFGRFHDQDGHTIDDVVVTLFREPRSYTGQDVVEISCHGGVFITRRILEAFLRLGVRLAAPGEFTKRAFLNGKIDLSQAEAVADLIHAKSGRSHKASLRQLNGELSKRITDLRSKLIEITGLLELELDFVEDGLEFADKKKIEEQMTGAVAQIGGLLATYKTGRLYREGVKVVLAGMPNVGKSSLLNALLRENRAIVTDIPGTTRDTIEEDLIIQGLMFKVVDTAGLRETVDQIEQEGVRRSHDQVRISDLLLLVLDVSRPLGAEELAMAERLVRDLKRESRPAILVLNKIDLGENLNGEISNSLARIESNEVVKVSALTGKGIKDLEEALFRTAMQSGMHFEDMSVTVTNTRHYDALRRARESLLLAIESQRNGESGEFVAVDLRAALDSLGEITGVVTTDDILNDIFSRFCVGK